uniref:Uncharacterized protein n=1 Tax=Ditylenchus dipsaci TaxID=166011 RepID=A0A915EER9_9BILA
MLIQSNAEAKELKKPKEFYKKFIDQLVLTLNSRARPYSNVHELEKDYAYDTGYNPQLVAMEFGFPTFDAFLKSDFMRPHVQMTMNDDGEPLFLPHENPIFKHIRDFQLASQNYLDGRKEKAEREKYARAMQPEFRGNILEGKKRLVELAYELGAETKDICYPDLQAGYLKKYDNMLGAEELRKFLLDDTMSGLIFLRLKRPYKEIVEMHEKMMDLQKEYEARKSAQDKARPESSQNNGRNWVKRKKVPLSERQLNLVPILPQVNDDLFKGISAVHPLDDIQQPCSQQPCDSQQPCSSSFQAHLSEEMNTRLPHSQFNKKDGGCTTSSLYKNFEDEYGGKANRKVENTLRHLNQMSDSLDDEKHEEVMPKSSSVLLCDRPSEVLTVGPSGDSSSPRTMNGKPNRPVKVEKSMPAKNDSLPLVDVLTRWRPETSSDSEEEQQLDGLTGGNIELSAKADSNSSSDRGADRAEALRDFIHAVVHLRSPEFVDLNFLLKTVHALDPNYKIVLETMSLQQFIKRNCDNAVVGVYKDSVLVGWRK